MINELTDNNLGSLIRLDDVEITNIYTGDGSFTLTVKDSNGDTVSIRKDSDILSGFNADMYSVGQTISVVAPLTKYQSNYQLMLTMIPNLLVNQIKDGDEFKYFVLDDLEILSKETQQDGSIIISVQQDDEDDDVSNDALSVIQITIAAGSSLDVSDLNVGDEFKAFGQMTIDDNGYNINLLDIN
jgi:hypothetical protein